MSKKIKILHIQETIHSGGVEKLRLLLAKYLDKSIYEQKIVCTFAQGPIVSEFEKEGIELFPIGRFHNILDFTQYRKIFRIINKYQPDIIHGAVFEGVTMACVCGFLKRVPVVIAEETSDPQNRTKKANLLLKFLTLAAKRVIAISPGTEEYLKNIAKIRPSKVRLINNGVECPRKVDEIEIKQLKAQLGITNEDIVIGSAGRLRNYVKRYTDLIEAISLLKNNTSIKIMIVGDGRDEEIIRQKARDCGVSDQLLMVGYQQDISLYYQLMDIFCLVSLHEGFGLVVAEAMSNSLPVIATAVGGLKHIVIDGNTGFLVQANNPQDITGKLETLINDPGLRKQFGRNGQKRAQEEYSAEIYVEKVNKLYKEMLPNKPSGKSDN